MFRRGRQLGVRTAASHIGLSQIKIEVHPRRVAELTQRKKRHFNQRSTAAVALDRSMFPLHAVRRTPSPPGSHRPD